MNVDIKLLVKNYQSTGCESSFNELYRIATAKWPSLLNRLAGKYYLDRLDVESMANLKLYQIAKSYDPSLGNFTNALSTAIKRGCIDLVRKKKIIDDHQSLVSANTDDEGNVQDPFENLATANAEDEIIEVLQKNRDQRLLIATLMIDADDNTRQCLSAYAETGSYRDAAKLLGKNDKNAVLRPIRKLSRKFDANQFGDIADYFTVPTVKAAN
jgi:hypothetical protein